MSENNKLIQKKEGYFQYANMPTKEELQNFYKEKYYQESFASYEKTYTEDELFYKKSTANLLVEHVFNTSKIKSILDIGCGEGYALDAFHTAGCKVQGVDFSSFGISHNNPHLLECFTEHDIYDYVENISLSEFDCVSMNNVIEHVLNPEYLLQKIYFSLSNNAYLLITFPNDFSEFQDYAKSYEKIPYDFWLAYPEHLSYFNCVTMQKLIESIGFKLVSSISNYPIDFALLNDDTNYIIDKSKGKEVHKARVLTHNFLYKQDSKKYYSLLKLYAEMGVGRNISFLCKKEEK